MKDLEQDGKSLRIPDAWGWGEGEGGYFKSSTLYQFFSSSSSTPVLGFATRKASTQGLDDITWAYF